jgi:hypothetical protein
VSGLGLALALLAVGPFAFAAVAVIIAHRLTIGAEPIPRRLRGNWRSLQPVLVERALPGLLGACAVVLAVAIAAPWYAPMAMRYGWPFWAAVLGGAERSPNGQGLGLASLSLLAPATTVLGALGLVRAIIRIVEARRAGAVDQSAVAGGALWVCWLMVMLVVLAFVSERASLLARLALLAPLNLLAAQTILDLAERRFSSRSLIWLAPATVVSLLWAALPELRSALVDVAHGRRPSANTTLALHVALDFLVIMGLAIRGFDRWTRSNDARRRLLIGVFLVAVLGFTFITGFREVQFRHRETIELLDLRDAIVRRHAERPLNLLAVVAADFDAAPAADPQAGVPLLQPGGRLRFVLRSALPHLAQIDLPSVQELRSLPDLERIVVLTGRGARLSYALQARLRLNLVHPGESGFLQAYATPIEPTSASPRVARRGGDAATD